MTEPNILSITKPISLIYTKEINGLWHADLEIEKNNYIQEECYIEFEKELFIARKINEIEDKNGLIFKVKLDHVMTELNDFLVGPFEYNGITCIAALASVLSGTTWSAGTSDIEGTGNIKSNKMITVLAAINLIAKEFNGEIDFHAIKQQDDSFSRIVDLKQQIGTVTKLQIRCDKNSDYIERERDPTKLITRLYLFGKDDITIESVNPTGKPYLDSPHISDYKNIKPYPLYTNIADKTVLMNYGQAYLNLHDDSIYRYKINTWNTTIIPKWADEVINLGDTLRVYNTDLKLNVDVRVKKIAKDLTDPRYQIIELADKFKSIVEPISDLQQIIKNITFQNDPRALDIRDVTFPRDIPTGLPRTWIMYVGGKLEVGYYQGPIVHVDSAGTAYEIWCYCAWKPTISDVVIRMNQNGVNIGEVTIPFGEYVAPGEGEVGAGALIAVDFPVAYGDLLNIDILATDGVAKRATAALRCN